MSQTPSLAVLIIEFLATQPGHAFTPSQIAEGVQARLPDRHVGLGAITVNCLHLAAKGQIVQASTAPKTFALVAPTDNRAGQQ